MLATFASVASILAFSALIGQALLTACGWRRCSPLAPAVGLAVLTPICWATVRLPGDGVVTAIVVPTLAILALVYLRGRVERVAEALREAIPVAFAALLAASLPFLVEGRFGILGTSLNPDMSQHLFAADRLAHGVGSGLENQGYPLGPHGIVVALHKGLGIGLVQGFSGLTVSVAAIAAVAALAGLADLTPARRFLAALLVGLPYMLASYLAQGAFKETMQALFLLAFALALGLLARGLVTEAGARRALPLAALGAGSAYAYSFPGLGWLLGAAGVWGVIELALAARRGVEREALRAALAPGLLAGGVLLLVLLPELGRLLDFRHFETFDPTGPGLGNLFHQISPLEALGIWPSGDFRLDPGAGSVPAAAFYLAAGFALVLLLAGLVWWLRRGEFAVPAALGAALAIYLAARIAATPYTAAKAVAMLAPLATLVIVRSLLVLPAPRRRRWPGEEALRPAAAAAFVVGAGGCAVLALGNAPVGPTSYSPALTELRPALASGSTLVLASRQLIDEEHGREYIAWELRGRRVCIRSQESARSRPAPAGVSHVVTSRESAAPFGRLRVVRRAGPYALWRAKRAGSGAGPCPLIAVRQARQGHPD